MRLLTLNRHNEIILTQPLNGDQIPPYAILSHTWGADSDEVKYAELQQGRAEGKLGYRKLQFCSEQAKRDQIKHFWIDTCCIDKTDSVELSEAINSMYRWYRDAEKCYVYLSDVLVHQSRDDGVESAAWEPSLQKSRWFARGWTLQELLAPKVVEFFSHDGVFLGTKRTLAEQICKATTLPLAALYGTPPAQFSIAERWRWAQGRQTSKAEDGAYCLFGIFDVFMPLIYGEGNHAFLRLEEKVNERSRVSGCVSENEDHMIVSLASRSHTAFTQHSYIDDGRAERAPKRRRIVQAEAEKVPDHEQSQQDPNVSASNHDDLVKSLLFERIDFRVNNVKRALLSTCQWLFRHPHFQAWHTTDSANRSIGFLWIKGKPGCGKSTLMKAAVEWTRRQTGNKRGRDAIVPYFFHARAAMSLEKSSLGLYRTVVHHLSSAYPPLRALFIAKYAYKDPGLSGEHWTAEELQDFLLDAVESEVSFKLILFIDALDEAEHEDDVRQMIGFLVQLSDRAIAAGSPCRLQICLSSRHYPHIRVGRGLSLVVEEQPAHREDIETYVMKQLTCRDGPGKDELRAEILNKSARIFLWVVLVVDMLNKLDDRGASPLDMSAHLETIPKGLNELFKDILTKSDHGIETSISFFQWMMFRMRPLEPAEMFVAMKYSRSPHDTTWTAPAELLVPSPDRLARFILDCSRGLVEVVEDAHRQRTVVQFIHETVREFLMKENGLASIVPALATNLTGVSHDVLRIACLRRISNERIPLEYEDYCEASHKTNASLKTFRSDMRRKLPFLDYAIVHLFDHAEEAQKHNISQRAFLQCQIDKNGLWLDFYRQWWNVLERYKTKKVAASTTLSYFIAERRYLSLLPVLLSVSRTVDNLSGRHGYMLHMASYHGVQEIVQILLDNSVDLNIQTGSSGSALRTASGRGHEKVVQMLLDAGADVNAKGGQECSSALHIASERGYEKVVQILLNAGADLYAPGIRYYSTPLQAALTRGHKKIVQMLLDTVADIDAKNGLLIDAFKVAFLCGHEQEIRILLDASADMEAHGRALVIALRMASMHNNGKIVQMLLDVGVDLNAQEETIGNALQAASGHGHEQIVQILLNAGADVNTRGGTDGTALQAASYNGHIKVVQILLKAGADVNALGGVYCNALQAASRRGHMEVVQMLLDAGADVNAQGGWYGNALQAALRSYSQNVVEILLKAGATQVISKTRQ